MYHTIRLDRLAQPRQALQRLFVYLGTIALSLLVTVQVVCAGRSDGATAPRILAAHAAVK